MAKSKYKAIKVDGVKHDYHRWLVEQELGRKLNRDEIVHHIDEDKSNNSIDNLQVMSLSEHTRQHCLGKKASPETLKKISEALLGNTNGSPRKLTNEQAQYVRDRYVPRDRQFGVRALAKRFGVAHSQISKIISGKLYTDVL